MDAEEYTIQQRPRQGFRMRYRQRRKFGCWCGCGE